MTTYCCSFSQALPGTSTLSEMRFMAVLTGAPLPTKGAVEAEAEPSETTWHTRRHEELPTKKLHVGGQWQPQLLCEVGVDQATGARSLTLCSSLQVRSPSEYCTREYPRSLLIPQGNTLVQF